MRTHFIRRLYHSECYDGLVSGLQLVGHEADLTGVIEAAGWANFNMSCDTKTTNTYITFRRLSVRAISCGRDGE